jgi:hypothetical protein
MFEDEFDIKVLKINISIMKIVIWIWNLPNLNSENWYFNSENCYLIMKIDISLFKIHIWNLFFCNSKIDIWILKDDIWIRKLIFKSWKLLLEYEIW